MATDHPPGLQAGQSKRQFGVMYRNCAGKTASAICNAAMHHQQHHHTVRAYYPGGCYPMPHAAAMLCYSLWLFASLFASAKYAATGACKATRSCCSAPHCCESLGDGLADGLLKSDHQERMSRDRGSMASYREFFKEACTNSFIKSRCLNIDDASLNIQRR